MTRESREEYLDRKAREETARRRAGTGLGSRPATPTPGLAALLQFEDQHPGPLTGHKGIAFYRTFPGLTAVRYWQLINRALDDPQALELNPTLVYRLREQRQARLTARNARTFTR